MLLKGYSPQRKDAFPTMAHYKPYNVSQITLVPVSFHDQVIPRSFEYALNEIADQHIDMRPFETRYYNDETGCLAYPRELLKIVLFAYYKGIKRLSSIIAAAIPRKKRVNTQWRLFNLVHNIEKLAHVGTM